jgi:hypothetical protein
MTASEGAVAAAPPPLADEVAAYAALERRASAERWRIFAREAGAFTASGDALADDHVGHIFTPVGARVIDNSIGVA